MSDYLPSVKAAERVAHVVSHGRGYLRIPERNVCAALLRFIPVQARKIKRLMAEIAKGRLIIGAYQDAAAAQPAPADTSRKYGYAADAATDEADTLLELLRDADKKVLTRYEKKRIADLIERLLAQRNEAYDCIDA